MAGYVYRTQLDRFQDCVRSINWQLGNDPTELLRQLTPIITDWWFALPDLRMYFRPAEIDQLLIESVVNDELDTRCICQFVANSGYTDQPDLDETGRPAWRRTTALHHAYERNYSYFNTIVPHLFKIYDRFDVNYTNDAGMTHFHVACQSGLDQIVARFLDAGHHPDLTLPATGDTTLHVATNRERRNVVELLLRRGANPNLFNALGQTALHILCDKGEDWEFTEAFFNCIQPRFRPMPINAQDARGNAPLHLALIARKKISFGRLLLEGADPGLINQEGLTPPHILCKSERNDKFVKMFFKQCKKHLVRVRVDLRSRHERTLLHYAVVNLWPDVVHLLLARGADLSGFVFPSAEQFARRWEAHGSATTDKVKVASSVLVMVAHLARSGYSLGRGEALTVMKIFDMYRLFRRSTDRAEPLHESPRSTARAQALRVTSRLSLNQLIWLGLGEIERGRSRRRCLLYWLPEKVWAFAKKCRVMSREFTLCEKLSRRFFAHWGADAFWVLCGARLPVECCAMIVGNLSHEEIMTMVRAVSDNAA